MKKIKQLLLLTLCLSFMVNVTTPVTNESTEDTLVPYEHFYEGKEKL